nr:8858_t:CDS:2 [Entrophospora candida]
MILNYIDTLSFLVNSEEKDPKDKLYLILGNESADLDSIISSISYALLSQKLLSNKTPLPPSDPSYRNHEQHTYYIPIIQINRHDFSLRQESDYVFTKCHIKSDQLVFLDDLKKFLPRLDLLEKKFELRLVLVDHNKLIEPWTGFSKNVDSIIDHHKDEGLYDAETRLIEGVGSATSLVALKFKEQWENQLKHNNDGDNDNDKSWNHELAKLLLAPILIDTGLLDISNGITTVKDQEAVKFLSEVLYDNNNSGEIIPQDKNKFLEEYYNAIAEARSNVKSLPSIDILRKDYKEWVLSNSCSIGISSVIWYIEDWIKRDGIDKLINVLKSYKQDHKLDLYIVLLSCKRPVEGFGREMIIYLEKSSPLVNKGFISELESSSMMKLKKLPFSSINNENDVVSFYKQEELTLSRKKVSPIIRELIENL